jgi:TolB protein
MNTRSAFGFGFVLFFSLSVIVAPALAQGDEEAYADLIVFAAEAVGEASDIYTIASDGSNLTRLTDDPAIDTKPRWSPDGTQIVFVSKRDGDFNFEIYLMDADGSNPVRLTDNPGPDVDPIFSPDGQYIAWASGPNPDMDNTDIWLMNADGSDKRQLTDTFENDRGPRWLPDSRTIMYISGTVDIDGNVIEPRLFYTDAVSPDGLLFLLTRSELVLEDAEAEEPVERPELVWVAPMDDRTAQVPITAEACHHFYPTWSPDGSQIVLTQSCPYDADENEEQIQRLMVINVDGSNPRVLTEGMDGYSYPIWRPIDIGIPD